MKDKLSIAFATLAGVCFIAEGILISISLLFSGLAITVVSLKTEV